MRHYIRAQFAAGYLREQVWAVPIPASWAYLFRLIELLSSSSSSSPVQRVHRILVRFSGREPVRGVKPGMDKSW